MAIELNRRSFIRAAAGVSLVVLAGETLLAQSTTGPSAPATPLDIGTTADYPKDGVYDKFLKSDRVIIAREDDRIYVMSARCTHRGSPLQVIGGNIHCPSHNSNFSPYGTVTSGPAKSSLSRFGVSLNDKKHLMVDKSKSFREKEWDDEGAAVSVKA